MSFQFWRRWLIVVTGGVIVYGFSLIVLPHTMHTFFNALFFSSSDAIHAIAEETPEFIALVYGVLGAVIIGWMTALMSLLMGAFQQGQRSAWNTLTLSVALWYALDTGFSLYLGSVAHALFNTIFFVMFALPLGATYRQFYGDTPASERKPTQDAT